jgi:hypothetical protein
MSEESLLDIYREGDFEVEEKEEESCSGWHIVRSVAIVLSVATIVWFACVGVEAVVFVRDGGAEECVFLFDAGRAYQIFQTSGDIEAPLLHLTRWFLTSRPLPDDCLMLSDHAGRRYAPVNPFSTTFVINTDMTDYSPFCALFCTLLSFSLNASLRGPSSYILRFLSHI